MAISVLEGFDYGGQLPNFSRDLFETVADMVAYEEVYLPPVFETNVVETGKRYRYNVSNSVDPELGKWREVTGGSGDLSNYYTKAEIDELVVKPVKEKTEQNEENIGEMADLEVSTWVDLVTAINSLYNSFMTSLVYTVNDEGKKVLRITYRNGQHVDVDISAIVTDSSIGDLKDVDATTKLEGYALVFEAATSKFKPKDLKLNELLQNAKDYTDEQIALYKRHKYNPMLGVVPLLIQIPLILGLVGVIYRPLSFGLGLEKSVVESLQTFYMNTNGISEATSKIQIDIINFVKDGAPANMDLENIFIQICGFKTNFFGLDLSQIPSFKGNYELLIIPVLSGLSAWFLCVMQNKINVLLLKSFILQSMEIYSIILVSFKHN